MGLGYSVVKTPTPVGFAVDLGTATASGAISQTDLVASMPKLPRTAVLVGGRLRATGAPGAGGSLTFVVLNGTNTAATAAINDLSLDAFVELSVPSDSSANEYNKVAAGTQLSAKVVGTSTASAQVLGDFDIVLDIQN